MRSFCRRASGVGRPNRSAIFFLRTLRVSTVGFAEPHRTVLGDGSTGELAVARQIPTVATRPVPRLELVSDCHSSDVIAYSLIADRLWRPLARRPTSFLLVCANVR